MDSFQKIMEDLILINCRQAGVVLSVKLAYFSF